MNFFGPKWKVKLRPLLVMDSVEFWGRPVCKYKGNQKALIKNNLSMLQR